MKALILAVAVVSGCAQGNGVAPTTLSVAIKEAGNNNEVISALTSAREWWSSLGADVQISAKYGTTWLYLMSDQEWLDRYTSLSGIGTESNGDLCGAPAACLRVRASYFDVASSDIKVQIMAHELGHAFGLRHVSDPNAIMAPEIGGHSQFGLTTADAIEWFRVHP